jgi:O-antigen ligase
MRTPERLAIGRLLGWTALLATVVVMPWTAYDPINVPKLAVITVGGFITLGILWVNRIEPSKPQYRLIVILTIAFILDLTLILLFSGTNFYQEFFGASGRSTGYVAYLALSSLLLSAAVTARADFLKNVTTSLLIAGFLTTVYGVAQALNLDPIKWANPYSPVIGFLGNPNFQSSFVGFSGVLAFSKFLGKNVKVPWRAGYVVYVLSSAYVIKETHSQQGFLVLLGGIAVVGCIWIIRSKFKFLTIPSLVLGMVGAVVGTFGSLNKGPLASALYKPSVTYRGDYWRAGWKMTVEHPFLGVGLDSFGEWYRRTRSVEATLRRGPEVVSNAAHNVLLDFSSTGGFPLLIIYLLMMLLVLVSAIKVLKRTSEFDPIFSGLFAVWIAYQAQSIISLNQLALAVWGWIISGLIIGYEINTRTIEVGHSLQKTRKANRGISSLTTQKVTPATTIGIFLGLSFGLIAGLPTLVASAKYKSAIESGDPKTYASAAELFPKDFIRVVQIAQNLENNGFSSQALELVESASISFPDYYEVWNVFSQISKASPQQKAHALAQMKRLDPMNPTLK